MKRKTEQPGLCHLHQVLPSVSCVRKPWLSPSRGRLLTGLSYTRALSAALIRGADRNTLKGQRGVQRLFHSQGIDGFVCAVHCGDVVGTRVVQHGVPVRKLLHPAGADMQGADWVADEQRDDCCNAALEQGGNMLQQRAGTAGGERFTAGL